MSDIKWTVDDRPFETLPTHGLPTLTCGNMFLICGFDGSITANEPHGLVAGDRRVLSEFLVEIDGIKPPAQTWNRDARNAGAFRCTTDTYFLERQLTLDFRENADTAFVGMTTALAITNKSGTRHTFRLATSFGADGATFLEVRNPAGLTSSPPRTTADGHKLTFSGTHKDPTVVTSNREAQIDGNQLSFEVPLLPGETWTVEINVTCGTEDLPPTQLEKSPVIKLSGDNDYTRWIARSFDDIRMLQMHGGVLAAGLPWFYAPFGRDTSMALLMTAEHAPPGAATSSLGLLAKLQGKSFDATTNEEPGRFPHEIRLTSSPTFSLETATTNYFSIDATPLWVLAIAKCAQRGLIDIEAFDANVDAALSWIRNALLQGEGLIRYTRSGDIGLISQGWKDSKDAIVFADGTPVHRDVALIEVQCYAELALREIAQFRADGAELIELADALRHRINNDFWTEDSQGAYLAMALDGHNKLVDGVGSNAGHGLMTGSYNPETAKAVVQQLQRPQMRTPFGVRTISDDNPSFAIINASAYHNGPMWPHDVVICALGMHAYGFTDEAAELFEANFRAAIAMQDGRLPEAHTGEINPETGFLRVAKRACSIQLWASATAIATYRTYGETPPWKI